MTAAPGRPPADTEGLREALAPGDPNARMNAYYYGFERTGIGIIDAILSAVAQAGKSYHSTEMWADEDEWTRPSHEARIQTAADHAAATLRAALLDGPLADVLGQAAALAPLVEAVGRGDEVGLPEAYRTAVAALRPGGSA